MYQSPIQNEEESMMKILKIEPYKTPKVIETDHMGLEWLQEQVGGYIEAIYPFEDPIAIICDEEGKLKGKSLNRALESEDGNIYDVLCGDFLVVGLGEEDFTGLSDELLEKYQEFFKDPDYIYIDDDRGIVCISYDPHNLTDDEEGNNEDTN